MTDTSRESVERLAKTYDAFAAAAKIWQKATKRYDQEAADTLRALLAALEAERAERERLREVLDETERVLALMERPASPDPMFHKEVKALGRSIGFGAMMATAEAGWREMLELEGYGGGEHVSGPTRSTVNNSLKCIRAALSREPRE